VCLKTVDLCSKCIKTHLRASVPQKNFSGSLSLAMRGQQTRKGEGRRGGEGRGGAGVRMGGTGRREGQGRKGEGKGKGVSPPKVNFLVTSLAVWLASGTLLALHIAEMAKWREQVGMPTELL
jgi:hypothetical protein